METDKCLALLCAIEEGSLSAAADKLGYTASGVSRMVAALEQETGFTLLSRGRGGVTPTAECRRLMPAMEQLVRWQRSYQQTAAEVLGLETGEVVIGASYGAYFNWLARLIADFTHKHPGIKVTISQGTSSELSQTVTQGKADFCIISYRHGDFQWIPLCQDELKALLPLGHPMAQLEAFPLAAFATEPFIEIYPGQETDNSILFQQEGITPNVRFSCSDSMLVPSMIEAGLGISLANSLVAEYFKGQVKALSLDPPKSVEIGIAIPSLDVASPAARSFIKYAVEHIE